MHDYTLSHLSDAALLRDLAALVSQDRITTVTLLAHIAEVDARKLYVPAGYSSMRAYCVEELLLSEDAAYRRVTAARAARQFPALFTAMAEGRLHLAALSMLAPCLTQENVSELIEAATHRRKSEIEELLARRFTIPNESARLRSIPATTCELQQLVPGRAGNELSLGSTEPALPQGEDVRVPSPAIPERFFLQVTIAKSTRDKLRHAQALLSHAVPSGDMAQVVDRALDVLIEKLERRKVGAVSSRWRGRRAAREDEPEIRPPRGGARHVPSHVRRAVWERDNGQCTFVGGKGNRCKATGFLEFDHVRPFARGGRATVAGIRLRCRAHNQYEAERAFGSEFMKRKRHEARLAAHEARLAAEEARKQAAADERSRDVVAGLRGLGCSVHEARRAAECSASLQGATLEDRLRAALKFLSQRSVSM